MSNLYRNTNIDDIEHKTDWLEEMTIESPDIQNIFNPQKILDSNTPVFDNVGKQKSEGTNLINSQNAFPGSNPSKLLKQFSSIAPHTSDALLYGSISQLQNLYVTQSLSFSDYTPLFTQITDSISNYKVSDAMLRIVNLDSNAQENPLDLTIQGDTLDSYDTSEKDHESQPLSGETICKTHYILSNILFQAR